MVRTTLLLAGLVALVAGAIYAFVASRLAERHLTGVAEKRAMNHFVVWWGATALNIILGGIVYVFAAFDVYDFTLQVSWAILQRMLLCVAVYGLLYYLIFLLWGRSLPAALAIVYAGFFVLLAYSVFAAEPTAVHMGEWRTDLEYAREAPSVARLTSLALIFPPVSLSYMGLFIALKGSSMPADARYRLAVVSAALIVWWTFAVIAGQREAIGQESFQLVNRFVGLTAALAVLAAFRPPGAVRRWLAGSRSLPS